MSFLTELRRRGVLRVAASYGAIAWLLVQIASAVADPLDLPRWAIRGLIFALVLGFPVAIGLAWFLEFTPQGVAVDRQPSGERRPATGGIRRYADLVVIGLLLLVVGYLVARQPDVVGLRDRATVAVLPFENLSTLADGEMLALGIAESVLHQLANLQSSRSFRARHRSLSAGGRRTPARSAGCWGRATCSRAAYSATHAMRVTTH